MPTEPYRMHGFPISLRQLNGSKAASLLLQWMEQVDKDLTAQAERIRELEAKQSEGR